MENILLHLKFMKGIRGTPLAYVVQHQVKVAYSSPWYLAYLNIDEEMIVRAPIVNAKSNIKLT